MPIQSNFGEKAHRKSIKSISLHIDKLTKRERERERGYPRIPKRIGKPSSVPLYKASSSTLNNLYQMQPTLATLYPININLHFLINGYIFILLHLIVKIQLPKKTKLYFFFFLMGNYNIIPRINICNELK